jgi:hypothetical protein
MRSGSELPGSTAYSEDFGDDPFQCVMNTIVRKTAVSCSRVKEVSQQKPGILLAFDSTLYLAVV